METTSPTNTTGLAKWLPWAAVRKDGKDIKDPKVWRDLFAPEDENKGLLLKIRKIKCDNLRGADRGGTSDPFVVFRSPSNPKEVKTSVIKKVRNLFCDRPFNLFLPL